MKEQIGVTEAIKQLLDQVDIEKKKDLVGAIFHYRDEYKRAENFPPESRAHSFQQAVQDSLNKVDYKKSGVSCSKGCSFCCMIRVDITEDEAILIKKHLDSNGIEINEDRFKPQEGFTKENWHTLQPKQRWCGFLTDKGECSIYDVRPIACRKYMVLDPPEKCEYDETQKDGGKIKQLVDWDAEIIQAGIMNAVEFDSIPNMILKITNP